MSIINAKIETKLASSPAVFCDESLTTTHAELWLDIEMLTNSEVHTYTVVTVNSDGSDDGVVSSFGNKMYNLVDAYERFKHVGGLILDLHNAAQAKIAAK